jgi:hypothetical protein
MQPLEKQLEAKGDSDLCLCGSCPLCWSLGADPECFDSKPLRLAPFGRSLPFADASDVGTSNSAAPSRS